MGQATAVPTDLGTELARPEHATRFLRQRHLPGLDLDNYYRAALEEANVGGDFYDVFPVEKCCIALVVGDLSGKGLKAASQVATIRNMSLVPSMIVVEPSDDRTLSP